MRTVEEWKALLRARLKEGLRRQDPASVAVIRSTLAAIDNAEAPDLKDAPAAQSLVIAGAVIGLGAGEVARRRLSPAEVTAIVEREEREHRDAAATYDSLGRASDAQTLRGQADLLDSLLRPARFPGEDAQ